MNRPHIYSPEHPARILAIMPHADDFEFHVGGTFALLKARYGDAVRLKIVTTSTGASGHHLLNADETFARRLGEARQSAALLGAEYECLMQLDGSHVEGQVLVNRNLLGGLWNTIRSFQVDYLFSPPPATDVLAGVHIDHEQTAQAIRLVAFQLGVPRAYPTIGREPDAAYRPPAIFLTDDSYSVETEYHYSVDIAQGYATKLAMVECHASQILEWLPFVSQRPAPTREEYALEFAQRHRRTNERFGFDDDLPREFFRLSRWGRTPSSDETGWLFGPQSR